MSTHDEVPAADDEAVVSSGGAGPDDEPAIDAPARDAASTADTETDDSAPDPAPSATDSTDAEQSEPAEQPETAEQSESVEPRSPRTASKRPSDDAASRRTPRRRSEAARNQAAPPARAASSPLSFSMPKIDVRHWLSTAREGVGTLLAKPLTSFHLVVSLAVILTVFGLLMVLSASSVEGFATQNSSYGAFFMQAVFVIAGWGLFYLTLRMPIRFYRKFATTGLVFSIVLLIVVLVPNVGVEVGGARRWFDLGGVSVQPSEIAKLMLCVWGAHVLASRRNLGGWSKELFLPLAPVALLICALLMLEPNLSTTIIVMVIVGALLWFSGLSMTVFAGFVGAIVAGAVVLALTADYRAARVFSFLGTANDPLDSGYQALQAKYALANGGLFGVGLGQSTAKWNYLPNAHNDFIFAIIGEELGLVGALCTVGLFLLLGYVGMRIARRSVDPFLRLLSATITTLMLTQMFINVGYVVGLLPVTGIQLPLLSQGGTSMLTMMTMLGLLATTARHEPEAVVALANSHPRGLSRLLRLPAPAVYRQQAAARGDRLERRRVADRLQGPSRDGRGQGRSSRGGASAGRSARVPQPEAAGTRGRGRRRAMPPIAGPAPRARARDMSSDEIHYSARQAGTRNPGDAYTRDQRRTVRGRAPGSPRRMENRNR